ncbi:hypothetical protein BT69DRAFT_402253 [Atractiella rhizophila]|nr:hypothetical protein BT69DRAFT_402253 [Atractiella rhizophila]
MATPTAATSTAAVSEEIPASVHDTPPTSERDADATYLTYSVSESASTYPRNPGPTKRKYKARNSTRKSCESCFESRKKCVLGVHNPICDSCFRHKRTCIFSRPPPSLHLEPGNPRPVEGTTFGLALVYFLIQFHLQRPDREVVIQSLQQVAEEHNFGWRVPEGVNEKVLIDNLPLLLHEGKVIDVWKLLNVEDLASAKTIEGRERREEGMEGLNEQVKSQDDFNSTQESQNEDVQVEVDPELVDQTPSIPVDPHSYSSGNGLPSPAAASEPILDPSHSIGTSSLSERKARKRSSAPRNEKRINSPPRQKRRRISPQHPSPDGDRYIATSPPTVSNPKPKSSSSTTATAPRESFARTHDHNHSREGS